MAGLSLEDFGKSKTASWADAEPEEDLPMPEPEPLPQTDAIEPAHQSRHSPKRQRDGRGPARDHKKRPMPELPTEQPFRAFVGNLPYDATEDQLAEFLQPAKIAKIRFVMDRQTERFKGFSYVDFEDRDSLAHALQMDGVNVAGRRLRVDVADDRNRPSRGRGPRGVKPPWEELPSGEPPKDRPKLQLKPRSAPVAPRESSDALASDAPKKQKSNPFGAAKPRELVLKERRAKEQSMQKAKPQPAVARGGATRGAAARGRGGVRGGVRGRGRGRPARGRGARGRGAAVNPRQKGKKGQAKPTTQPRQASASEEPKQQSVEAGNMFDALSLDE